MNITNDVCVPAIKRLGDVKLGQVFSIDGTPYILLMTDSNRYVHLRDGSSAFVTHPCRDMPVKIYEREPISKRIL